jgi:hypothetical protein
VVRLGRGELETSPDVSGFKIGIVFEDFLFRNPGGKEVKHVHDTDAHPSDAGAATALFRVECDSIHGTHNCNGKAKAASGDSIFRGSGSWMHDNFLREPKVRPSRAHGNALKNPPLE